MSRVVAVTGSTGVIGGEICKNIAKNKKYELVCLARNETKVQKLVKKLKSETKNDKISYMICDVSSEKSIIALRKKWGDKKPLYALVNNAVIVPKKRSETKDGIESTWATNVLGYFWMAKHFADILKKSAPSRIINVGSHYAMGLDLDDVELKYTKFGSNSAYTRCKQANRMMTVAMANRLKKDKVAVFVCHPGVVSSNCLSGLGYRGWNSVEESASTPTFLVLKDDVATLKETGGWYAKCEKKKCKYSEDSEEIEKLYKILESY